jgi:uncharacterized protein
LRAYNTGLLKGMEPVNEEPPIHPGVSVLIFVATVFLGFAVIGLFAGFFLALPFYPGDFDALQREFLSGSTSQAIRIPHSIMQASVTGIGLIVIPLLAYRYMVKMKVTKLLRRDSWLTYALVVCAVMAFLFPNSIIIEWNANWDFSGTFWDWARATEAKGAQLTAFLTTFQSPGEFVGGFIIIAVLAAVGEEFTFRGWLQPAIQKWTGNPHVAIWLSAIAFSAFHFQFFGFVPRMLLGALFGYFMYWSNNLWLPILAHFVNNGLMVVLSYLNQLKIVEVDVDDTDALPLTFVVPSAILFIVLMAYLKKITQPREETFKPIY